MAFEGNMVTVDGKVYRVEIKPQTSRQLRDLLSRDRRAFPAHSPK